MKTVYGRLADPLGHASASGRAWASPAAAYLREQNPEIRVDVDHSYVWCGSILFLAVVDRPKPRAREHGRSSTRRSSSGSDDSDSSDEPPDEPDPPRPGGCRGVEAVA